jgi:hypothetical protein
MHTNYPLNPRQWRRQAQAITPTVQETHVGTIENDYQEALNTNDLERALLLQHQIDAEQEAREARLNAPDALLNAALWYVDQGIPVFPVRPGEKRPLTQHGFKDATLDPDQIHAWWTTTPPANIGLPTGARFDVIDVDGQPGYESYAKLRAGGDVPDIIGRANTPRGIHVYIHPTGDGNTTSLLPGIDYRGAGGYVLAPPSRLTNGAVYRWQQPLTLQAQA